MKKLLCVGVALTLLSACTAFDPDLETSAADRAAKRSEIRNQIGCQFVDDHDAYRRCVIATYEHNKPKTFMTSQDCNGRPVAVVSSGETKGVVSAEITSITTEVAPVAAEVVTPTYNLGVAPCATSNCLYKTQELYEAEMAPCATCVPQPIVVEQPKIVKVEQVETVVEKPLEVVPAPQPLPDKTWWETYQETKEPEQPKVVCPCPDPNDPCPQCVTK